MCIKVRRLFLALAACVAGGVSAAALRGVYATPGYVCGIWNNAGDAGMSKVPTTPVLAGSNLTLQDFRDGVTYWAYVGSGAMNQRGEARCSFTHAHLNDAGERDFFTATVQKYDDKYIKAAVYKFTQGADGVYVQQLATPYKQIASTSLTTWDFVNVATDGTITYDSAGLGNYNFYCFTAMKWVPTAAPARFFRNTDGEPTLTVDDLRDYRFSGVVGGGSGDRSVGRARDDGRRGVQRVHAGRRRADGLYVAAMASVIFAY